MEFSITFTQLVPQFWLKLAAWILSISNRLRQSLTSWRRLELSVVPSAPGLLLSNLVPKPDGSCQPCGNYRRLNSSTTSDCYPLSNLQDLSSPLHGSSIFSKLDLVKAYHQVLIYPPDIPKTAVITPFGLYEHLNMPYSLCNTTQTFQRLMNNILHDLPFVLIYLTTFAWPAPPFNNASIIFISSSLS